jgi:hypothetical protein
MMRAFVSISGVSIAAALTLSIAVGREFLVAMRQTSFRHRHHAAIPLQLRFLSVHAENVS